MTSFRSVAFHTPDTDSPTHRERDGGLTVQITEKREVRRLILHDAEGGTWLVSPHLRGGLVLRGLDLDSAVSIRPLDDGAIWAHEVEL